MSGRRRSLVVLVLTVVAVGCGGSSSPTESTAPPVPIAGRGDVCAGYGDWSASPFVLPYGVGERHLVTQDNCTPFTHSGRMRYAYDFDMPVGTEITAARAGVVVYLEEHWPDGDGQWYHSNLVRIDHGDGTYALYAHLTTDGVLVEVGDRVAVGEVIALSGNSGYTLDQPHLHFHVAPCSFYELCGTVPVTFRNTDPNPAGLAAGRQWPALPY